MQSAINVSLTNVSVFDPKDSGDTNSLLLIDDMPDLIAPASVWMEAPTLPQLQGSEGPDDGRTYDPSFHEITYVWSLRGHPLSPFEAPQNMIEAWKNPNRAYGKTVAFCLNKPGNYIVDLLAVDAQGASVRLSSDPLVVRSPEEAYLYEKTIVVALDGQFNGKPERALEANSLAALQSILAAAAGPTRVLFKRGEVYPDVQIRIDRSVRLSHIGAWSSGAKPILKPVYKGRAIIELWQEHNEPQLTLDGLRFEGDWDATTETGWVAHTPVSIRSALHNDTYYTIHDCESFGFTICLDGSFNKSDDYTGERLLIANCALSNWQSYGIYLQNGHKQKYVALIGNRIAQIPDALDGGRGKRVLHNWHGPIRIAHCNKAYIAQNDLFARGGWSFLNPGLADQPCIRLDSKGVPNSTYILDRNVCEGGFKIVALSGEDESEPDHPGNYLLDKNLLIATGKLAGSLVDCSRGGTTIRNTVGVIFDVLTAQSGNSQDRALVRLLMDNPAGINADEPIRLYNNTLLNLQSSDNDRDQVWRDLVVAEFNNVTSENNVLHAPSHSTPVTEYAPFDLSSVFDGIIPRWRGIRYGFGHIENMIPTGGVPAGDAMMVPYSLLSQELGSGEQSDQTTDQAYWQSLPVSNNRHMLRLQNGTYFHAHMGDFTVSYANVASVILTNTSGLDWPEGGFRLKLDRSSLVPPMDKSQQSPSVVPKPLLTGSLTAPRQIQMGLKSYDTFLGEPRSVGGPKGAL